jgi:hypothetical protein
MLVWSEQGYDANQTYLDEMRLFLQYVREGRTRHEYDARNATQSLAIADAAFASVQSGCFESIPDWVRALS